MRPAAPVAVVLGLGLLGSSIFGMAFEPTSTRIAYVGGIALVAFGVASLVRTGWHGSGRSWLVAASTAGVLTWTLYELIRQGVPLYGIGVLGEMTAPAVSFAVVLAILLVGWLRTARSDRGAPSAPGHPIGAAPDHARRSAAR